MTLNLPLPSASATNNHADEKNRIFKLTRTPTPIKEHLQKPFKFYESFNELFELKANALKTLH